jgi:CheY-like chemotaxis protein
MDDYLSKPIVRAELLAVLAQSSGQAERPVPMVSCSVL